MVIKKGIWLIAISMITAVAWSQSGEADAQKGSLDGGSLQSQYEYMVEESNNFEEYKVIRKTWVDKFGTNLNDSLEAQVVDYKEAADLAAQQETTISDLRAQLSATQDSLNSTQQEKQNMAWLGMDMEKSNYRVLMWSIIGALVVIAIILLFMYKRSNAVTRDSKEKLDDLDEEFTEYKKRSLEREQKLRRELQDEINKQKMQK